MAESNRAGCPRQWLGRAGRGTKVLRKTLSWFGFHPPELSTRAPILYVYSPMSSTFASYLLPVSAGPGKIKTSPGCALRRTVAFVTLLVSFIVTPCLWARSQPAADLIIRNAKIWTVDKSHPTAQAVAVLGDRIVAVGSNREVDAWHGARTRTIDAAGKLLLPGFNDAHVHFVDGGLALDRVQLNDATSAEEFARRIGERAKQTPKGEWVMGGDWDETKWTPGGDAH